MYYHARITVKPASAKERVIESVELDLKYEDLLAKIVVPFLRHETFFCGGAVIDAQRVRDVHFNETTQSSQELLPFLRAERRAHGFFASGDENAWIVETGNDVTRRVLDDARTKVVQTSQKEGDISSTYSNRIFVVHGHDIAALDQTELLLRRWGLDPVILRDKPNRGMTVIEKVEANTEVGYGIVLLTPDDLGGVDASHQQPRARQNVIFEWGYLMAKLGRERVACLYKKGVELPSDLHGIVRIEVGTDIRENAEELKRELVAAGYKLREP
jgi:predicted nucleotide-binding protein